jgi:phosphopantetheinyl transferase
MTQWARSPASMPSLSPGALHVWRADLDRAMGVGDASLSAAELDRAARFRSDPSRERWMRARAILRDLLGGYLDRGAQALEFELGPHGKPVLPDGGGIEFNLSHSAGTALFAFALENAVGVDIEIGGRARDFPAIAEREFGEAEAERLRGLPEAEREPEFLRSWARHEAALKCHGDSLGAPDRQGDLFLLDLDVGPRAAAAVALERAAEPVSLWELGRPTEPDS